MSQETNREEEIRKEAPDEKVWIPNWNNPEMLKKWEAFMKELYPFNDALHRMANRLIEMAKELIDKDQELKQSIEREEQLRKLLEAQAEYIKFLSEHMQAGDTIMFTHGFKYPDEVVEKGKELRQRISIAQKALNP